MLYILVLRTVDWSTADSLLFVSGTKMAALVYGTVFLGIDDCDMGCGK